MRVVVAGATGFVGKPLVSELLGAGYDITVIGRDDLKIHKIWGDRVKAMTWADFEHSGEAAIRDAVAVINLAGADISEHYWTAEVKQNIIDSRVQTTRVIARCVAWLGPKAPVLLNASAIGIYGEEPKALAGLPKPIDEQNTANAFTYDTFSAEVVRAWENALLPAKQAGVRVVNLRFGIILAAEGGVLAKLKWPYQLGLGGRLGDGLQPFPWVTRDDVIRAIRFLMDTPDLAGPFNIVAPQGITQAQFAQALADAMHRPAFSRTPAFMVKLMFGQMGEELLLQGQHVIPAALTRAGFTFKYPTIQSALAHIFPSSRRT